jgi:DNA-binding response OmpR family regulator
VVTPASPEKRVVLVEDDAPLAGLLVRYLKRLNIGATFFRRPAEALEHLRGQPADLLITDLTLGDENGADLARSALELDSSLRVLLMSGYPYEPVDFPETAHVAFLQKPFLPNMLQNAIQALLEAQDCVSSSADSSLAAKLSPDSDQS